MAKRKQLKAIWFFGDGGTRTCYIPIEKWFDQSKLPKIIMERARSMIVAGETGMIKLIDNNSYGYEIKIDKGGYNKYFLDIMEVSNEKYIRMECTCVKAVLYMSTAKASQRLAFFYDN